MADDRAVVGSEAQGLDLTSRPKLVKSFAVPETLVKFRSLRFNKNPGW
jgi:hypothetical protein